MEKSTHNKIIKYGFYLAGLANIAGVLNASKFFTDTAVMKVDPQAMSQFGLIMIIVWGLAYISVANSFANVKWLIAVFAIEKLCYGLYWTNWILDNGISKISAENEAAISFYKTYGVNDWFFFVFFSYVFIRLIVKKS